MATAALLVKGVVHFLELLDGGGRRKQLIEPVGIPLIDGFHREVVLSLVGARVFLDVEHAWRKEWGAARLLLAHRLLSYLLCGRLLLLLLLLLLELELPPSIGHSLLLVGLNQHPLPRLRCLPLSSILQLHLHHPRLVSNLMLQFLVPLACTSRESASSAEVELLVLRRRVPALSSRGVGTTTAAGRVHPHQPLVRIVLRWPLE